MLSTFTIIAAAGGAPAGAGGGQAQSPLSLLMPFAIMIAIMYFILIRPQRRREAERRALLDNVKSGDRVLFGGGLIGTVTNVKEKVLIVKVADKVKLEAARGAVTQILEKGELPSEDLQGA